MNSPSENMNDLELVETGWEQFAPEDEFNEIKFADYKTQVQKSREVRQRLAAARNLVSSLENERDDTDEVGLEMRGLVVRDVRGKKKYGPNSTLYQSFGYKRESEYESGLTHKTKDDDDTEDDGETK